MNRLAVLEELACSRLSIHPHLSARLSRPFERQLRPLLARTIKGTRQQTKPDTNVNHQHAPANEPPQELIGRPLSSIFFYRAKMQRGSFCGQQVA